MLTEVKNNDEHHHIIPFKKLEEWYEWIEQEDNDKVPIYAEKIQ